MNFYVLTLFPELIKTIVGTSITGRALKKGFIGLDALNIRDFSEDRTGRVDDYTYGGGAGLVMEAEPVFRAVSEAKKRSGSEKTRVIYLTPQADVLSQTKVEELAGEKNLILLCGHYEGVDERVLQECVTDYISIGDYVLTGGELGAAVLIDAVSRFVPGVLSNEESSQFESLQDNLLEYPQYTRPEEWHGEHVPEVLLTGDHSRINGWRYEQSLIRTRERRPDLMRKYYRTTLIFWGSERAAGIGRDLMNAVTRYGTELDYNRRKLQKTAAVFGERDLVLFVFDRETGEVSSRVQNQPDDGEMSSSREEVSDSARLRNVTGHDTPAVCIEVTGNAGTGSCGPVDEADTFMNDEQQWDVSMVKLEMFLSSKGFRVIMTSSAGFEEKEKADEFSDPGISAGGNRHMERSGSRESGAHVIPREYCEEISRKALSIRKKLLAN